MVSGLVKSLSLLLNGRMQEKTSGVQAFVTIGSSVFSVFSLTSPSEIFRGRGYSFAGLYSVGAAILEQTLKAFQISCTFLTTSIIFKMGDNFSLPHIRSFDSSRKDKILAQHDKLSSKPEDECTPIMGVLFALVLPIAEH